VHGGRDNLTVPGKSGIVGTSATGPFLMKTLVFTATYNEVDNIRELVDRILEELPGAEVLVIDDSSSDGTAAAIELHAAERYPGRVKTIVRPRKLGVGSAHKLAVKYALAHGFDRLITMDADFSHDPRYLPRMMRLLDDHDFVIGSRYTAGGRCEYPIVRRWFSRAANALARSALSIPLRETTTSYRGFRRELLERLDVDSISGDGYSYFLGSSYRATQLVREVAEFPIVFVDRRAGTTKISRDEIFKGLLALGRLTVDRISGRGPKSRSATPVNAMPCNACGSMYHVEVYEASVRQHTAAQYTCTTTGHESHGRIVRCLGCGLVFTNPQLPPKEVEALYEEVEDPTYVANADARVRTFTYNLDRIAAYLPAAGRLLDVGSYTGTFLEVARARGFDATGVEPSKWAARYANEELGLTTIQGTIDDVPRDLGRFDVVCSWDVLEHLPDPLGELRKINERTAPNGVFAFSTLNWDSWPPRLLRERWPWLMDMHLYYFDEEIVGDMLAKAGFALKHVGTYCHIITADYFMGKLASLGVPGARFARRVVRSTPLRRVYIPFRFGDIQLFVAEKVRDLDNDPIDTTYRRPNAEVGLQAS
jgi:2-polyprenyl-3-methyl-5-hydroxy-6-metoxy-1,4-benzoquinol methylase